MQMLIRYSIYLKKIETSRHENMTVLMRIEEDEWHVQAIITHVHVQSNPIHVVMTMSVIKFH